MHMIASAGPAVDLAERNRRVLANQGLVCKIARGFRNRGVAFEDLVGYGNVGLIEAAGRFDAARGWKFSTFATFSIRRYVVVGLAKSTRMVALNQRASREAADIRRCSEALAAGRGSPPLLSEVLDAMGPSAASRERLYDAVQASRPASGARDVRELTASEMDPLAGLVRDEQRGQIRLAMELLSDEQREVLARRYGLDGPALSARQTAAALGARARDVERLEADGIARLRRLLNQPPGAD